MRLLFPALAAIRAPLAVTAAVICLLFLPDQSREVFVALQEADGLALAVGATQAAVTIGLFLLVLTLAGLLAIKAPTDYRRAAIVRHEAVLRAAALAAPAVVLVALVLLNLDAAGVGQCSSEEAVEGCHDFRFASLLVLVPAAAVIFLSLWAASGFSARLADRLLRIPLARPWLTFRGAGWFVLVTFALCVAWSFFHVPSFSALLGTVGVVFLFLSILTASTALLARVYDEWHWPVTTILIVAALGFSYFPLNDNHHVRVVRGDFPKVDKVDEAFLKWLKNRPDRDDFRGRPYPIYIVAAEGGGIYAAAHTAWVLAALQDDCPQFAHHLFAISAVSGGSVGASLFSALLDLEPPPEKAPPAGWCNAVSTDGSLRKRVKDFFQEDLLTPVLSAGLFPDLLQRFLFFRVPPFDRARALEDALQRAWHRAAAGAGDTALGTLDKTLFDSWRPHLSRPALLLNTAAVQFGHRIILAPFALLYRESGFAEGYVDTANNAYDSTYWKAKNSQPFRIPLQVATALSARFPFVTPPGTLPADAAVLHPIQVADGGYYDNSAILTVLNLVDRIKVVAVKPPASASEISKSGCSSENLAWFSLPKGSETAETISVCFRFIVIRRSPAQFTAAYRGDLLSPLAVFREVWTARSVSTYSTLKQRYCGGANCGLGKFAENPHVYAHTVSPQILTGEPDAATRPLPRGWMLSEGTFKSIFKAAGRPLECKDGAEETKNQYSACIGQGINRIVCAARIENQCLLSRIRANLMGEQL
jgi:hypothetical protein